MQTKYQDHESGLEMKPTGEVVERELHVGQGIGGNSIWRGR